MECRDSEDESDSYYGKYCAICGWPINRIIKKEEVQKFFSSLATWLKKKNQIEIFGIIKAKVKSEDLFLCRYDFFEMIQKILENLDQKLGEEFNQIFTKKYDFQGSIIS